MKKTITMGLLLSGFMTTVSFAQDYLRIQKKDGSVVNISLKGIEKLTFSGLVTANPAQQAMAIQVLQKLSMFPNPASGGLVNVAYELSESSLVSMELYNEQGQMVHRVEKGILSKGAHMHQLVTSEFTNGLYICKIITSKGIEPKKIVIHN